MTLVHPVTTIAMKSLKSAAPKLNMPFLQIDSNKLSEYIGMARVIYEVASGFLITSIGPQADNSPKCEANIMEVIVHYENLAGILQEELEHLDEDAQGEIIKGGVMEFADMIRQVHPTAYNCFYGIDEHVVAFDSYFVTA